jgi:hypothetical protein
VEIQKPLLTWGKIAAQPSNFRGTFLAGRKANGPDSYSQQLFALPENPEQNIPLLGAFPLTFRSAPLVTGSSHSLLCGRHDHGCSQEQPRTNKDTSRIRAEGTLFRERCMRGSGLVTRATFPCAPHDRYIV